MYFTFKSDKFIPEVTFEDLLNNFTALQNRSFTTPDTSNEFHTYTKFLREGEYDSRTLWNKYKIENMLSAVVNKALAVDDLLEDDMSPHYETFHIPKHSGGFRRIDAPKPELMSELRDIKEMFEKKLYVLPHDCAYAYVKHRSTKQALEVHQRNESRWFLKLDVKDFFPSCNFEFIMKQLKQLFPFTTLFEVMDTSELAVKRLIKLCLLNNSLPQGTPMSPLLTNLIMLPIDYDIRRTFIDFDRHNFKYTRYADDILISCKFDFDWHKAEEKINEIFQAHQAPFRINSNKTRYGSSSGRNWNLGLMLNKDNEISIGHKKKQRLKSALFNFFNDLTSGTFWSILDTQTLIGQISYFKNIEPEYTNYLIKKYEDKFQITYKECIKRIFNPN